MEDAYAHALGLAREARRIEVFTGAGMSAESGLDTFRDARRVCGRTWIRWRWRR